MVNMCPYCEVAEAKRHRENYACDFCFRRLWRLRMAYHRAGKRFTVRNMRRSWKHWRVTPELDALYLDPIERAA